MRLEAMQAGNFGFGVYIGIKKGRFKFGLALWRWMFRVGPTD